MQQIAKYDRELNYLPFRYRNRSTTNPKNTHPAPSPYSYSRGKHQKYNPEKASWDHRIAAIGQGPPSKQDGYEGGHEQFQGEKWNGLQEGRQGDKGNNAQGDKLVASQLHSRHSDVFHEAQAETETDQPPGYQESSPIKKLHHLQQFLPQNSPNEDRPEAEKGVVSPQKMSSIFNESDVREIKESILNNIRHSQSQNQLYQNHSQTDQQQTITLGPVPEPPSHDTQQKLGFDVRYERLRALNHQYEENQQFNRNLKRREMIKKAKKVKPHQLNSKLQVKDNTNLQKQPQQLVNDYLSTPISNKKADIEGRIAEIRQVTSAASAEDKGSEQRQQLQLTASHAQKQREGVLNNHSTSINTTHSSYARHREDKPKSNQILTFDKYKRMKAKQVSIENKRRDAHPIPKKSERQDHQTAPQKIYIHPIQIEVREDDSIQPHKETQADAPSSILAQFTTWTGSKAMAEVRQAKSKEKQQNQQLKVNGMAVVGYGNRQFPPSSYRSKHIQNSQSYSVNMKKKKEKGPPSTSKAPQKYTHTPASPLRGHLDKIQQETCSIHDHESLKDTPLPSQQYQFQTNGYNNHGQWAAEQVQNRSDHFSSQGGRQENENCKIGQLDLQQLQEGIAFFLGSEREGNRSKARSRDSSHPTSRVYERNLEDLKSEDGEELLKIMAVNTNFKELSSLVFEDRSPEQHDLSLVSQELCEIINSNQSQFSATPTPQNVSSSSSSSSLHYPFEGDEGKKAFGGPDGDGSAFIQINEDSRVFQERLGFPTEPTVTSAFGKQAGTLNLEDIRRQGSRPPSQGQGASSRRSNQAQAGDCSIRDYRSHFHPSDAIRKFRHAKHNSADFQQKSLKSARINHSLSTLRRNVLNFESCERVKTRLERNKTRFRTRLADH